MVEKTPGEPNADILASPAPSDELKADDIGQPSSYCDLLWSAMAIDEHNFGLIVVAIF